ARYVYYPHAAMVAEPVAVNVRNRSNTIRAEIEIPATGAEGVLLALGSLVGLEEHAVRSRVPILAGAHVVECQFTKTGEHAGRVALAVDGEVTGEGDVPRFTPTRFSITGAGLTCGRGNGLAVTDDYTGAFPFTGRIRRVVVDVAGEPFRDPEGEAEVAITTQ